MLVEAQEGCTTVPALLDAILSRFRGDFDAAEASLGEKQLAGGWRDLQPPQVVCVHRICATLRRQFLAFRVRPPRLKPVPTSKHPCHPPLHAVLQVESVRILFERGSALHCRGALQRIRYLRMHVSPGSDLYCVWEGRLLLQLGQTSQLRTLLANWEPKCWEMKWRKVQFVPYVGWQCVVCMSMCVSFSNMIPSHHHTTPSPPLHQPFCEDRDAFSFKCVCRSETSRKQTQLSQSCSLCGRSGPSGWAYHPFQQPPFAFGKSRLYTPSMCFPSPL